MKAKGKVFECRCSSQKLVCVAEPDLIGFG